MYHFTQKHNKIILIVVCVVLLPFIGLTFTPLLNRLSADSSPADTVGTFEMPAGVTHTVSIADLQSATVRGNRLARILRGTQIENVDDAWAHLLQVAEARMLGVRVSDEELDTFITEQIRKPGRLFSGKDYRTWLKRAVGLTSKDFRETLREYLMRDELRGLYSVSDEVTMEQLLERYQEDNREVSVRFVRFDVDQVRKGLKPVDFPLASLEKFYADPTNRALLMAKEELTLPRLFEEVEVIYGHFDKFDLNQPAMKTLLTGFEPSPQDVQSEYERWKTKLYTVPAEKPADKQPAKDPAEDPAKEAPAADKVKSLAEVREDVVKRLKFKAAMERIRIEAEVAVQQAKVEAEAEKKRAAAKAAAAEKPAEKAEEKTAAPAKTARIRVVAEKYGLEYQKAGPLDFKGLEKLEPFAKEAPDSFAYDVRDLEAGKFSPAQTGLEKVVYFAYLVKDQAVKLKPLVDIESGVREVAMDEDAIRIAREKADAFHDAMKAEVKKDLMPRLEKEVYAPTRELEAQEIAAENEARKKAGKPELSAEELKTIKARYTAQAESKAAPIINREEIAKLGEKFDAAAEVQKLTPAELTFFLPAAGSMGRDFRRRTREMERDPERGFLRYSAGIEGLEQPGQVLAPVEDGDRAAYVVKLTATRPAEWTDMDPGTYRDLTMMMSGGMGAMGGMGGGGGMARLQPEMFELRYRLATDRRYRPEEEEQAPEVTPKNAPPPPPKAQ